MAVTKDKVFTLIASIEKGRPRSSTAFNFTIIGLILLSFFILITETFSGLPLGVLALLLGVDLFITIVFTIEYGLRVWTADKLYPHLSPAKARLRFIVSGWSIIDLLAILPFYLLLFVSVDSTALRALRLLRILRLLKLGRYTTALNSVFGVLHYKRHELVASVGAVLMLMVVASVLMYYAENEMQPEVFEDAISGLWWAVATVTTVGYGDIYPVTMAGKLLAGSISLLGIALVAIPTGIISSGLGELRREREQDELRRHE